MRAQRDSLARLYLLQRGIVGNCKSYFKLFNYLYPLYFNEAIRDLMELSHEINSADQIVKLILKKRLVRVDSNTLRLLGLK